jgi:hypothetical protein
MERPTNKIIIAKGKFPNSGNEDHDFLNITFKHYLQTCESLFSSFFTRNNVEVQREIIRTNFGLTNDDINKSWEPRAAHYKMTPGSFSFFLHVAMYSARASYDKAYESMNQRSFALTASIQELVVEKHTLEKQLEKAQKKPKKKSSKKSSKKKSRHGSLLLSDDDSSDDFIVKEYCIQQMLDDDQSDEDRDVNIDRPISGISTYDDHTEMEIIPDETAKQLDVIAPITPQALIRSETQQPEKSLADKTKSSNTKKLNKRIPQNVITGHNPTDDGTSRVRDILVYDIPVS